LRVKRSSPLVHERHPIAKKQRTTHIPGIHNNITDGSAACVNSAGSESALCQPSYDPHILHKTSTRTSNQITSQAASADHGEISSINSSIETSLEQQGSSNVPLFMLRSKPPTTSILAPPYWYHDFSRHMKADAEKLCTKQRRHGPPLFPKILYEILSRDDITDIISWCPHGRAWRVHKPKVFEDRVLSEHFRHSKYQSFTRQVTGWGFRRITQDKNKHAYYHENFLRGSPHLLDKINRAAATPAQPDFYRMAPIWNLWTSVSSNLDAFGKENSYGTVTIDILNCNKLWLLYSNCIVQNFFRGFRHSLDMINRTSAPPASVVFNSDLLLNQYLEPDFYRMASIWNLWTSVASNLDTFGRENAYGTVTIDNAQVYRTVREC